MVDVTFDSSEYSKIFWLGSQKLDRDEQRRYHIYGQFHYEINPNLICLTDALQSLVDNNYNLRSVFKENSGQLLQTVRSDVRVKLDIYNAQNSHEYRQNIENIIAEPFDLQHGPLFRFAYISQKGTSKGVFLPIFHHIIIDGTQFDKLMEELSGFYQLNKNSSTDDKSKVYHLKDYISWERKQDSQIPLTDEQINNLKDAATETSPLFLVDKNTIKGKPVNSIFELDQDIYQNMKTLTNKMSCSVFDIVRIAWGALICKYFDQNKAIISFPFNARRGEYKNIKGAFLNLALFILPMQKSFAHILKQEKLNKRNWKQYYHNIIKLMKKIGVSKIPFAVSPAELLLKGPYFESKPKADFAIELGSSDLCLFFNIDDGNMKYGIVAEQSLFNAEQLSYMNKLFIGILKQICEDQHSNMEHIVDAALKKQFSNFRHLADNFINDNESENITNVFESCVEQHALSPALVLDNKTLSYAEINMRANQLARFITKQYKEITGQPIKRDNIIPIITNHSLDFIIAILAIIKSGSAYLPIDEKNSPERTLHILQEVDAKLIISCGEYASNNVLSEEITILSCNDIRIQTEDSRNLKLHIAPSNLAYVMYTSGTSGVPKGVMVEHKNVVSLVKNVDYFEADEKDCFGFFSDAAFDASIFEIFGSLLNGSKLYIPSNRLQTLLDAKEFYKCINSHNINLMWLTKSLFDSLFNQDKTIFHSLKYLIIGGEALNQDYIFQLYKSDYSPKYVLNGYGPTENTTFSYIYKINSSIDNLSSVPIGKPLKNRYGYVLDKNNNILPPGAIGLLYLGGAGVARGYLKNTVFTQQAFVSDKFTNNITYKNARLYNSKDIVRELPCGNLDYIGRDDSQVKLRGYRIELQEIEFQLRQYPEILQSVACIKEINGDTHLIAYFTAHSQIDTKDLRSYLIKKLPTYMVPHIFDQIDKIPITANGKVDLLLLETPNIAHEESLHIGNEYCNVTETKLHNIWSNILHSTNFDANLSFFELGGDSLKIIELKGRIELSFKIKINIADLFEKITFNEQINFINSFNKKNEPLLAESNKISPQVQQSDNNGDIAIIGMACRLPNEIESLDEYWDLLKKQGTTLRNLSAKEIALLSRHQLDKANFVPRASIIESHYEFDASFFGYSQRDATLLDPQQRMFLEVTWQALENSGNMPKNFSGDIGLFASQGQNRYFYDKVINSSSPKSPAFQYQAMISNEKDFLATRTAFKLNLTGPAVSIQTGCSSSLVAVNQAVNSLKNYECDMTIAGGVALLDRLGYVYQKDMIESPDGYCRAFDEKASGTIGGSGVGVVILKRLKDAKANKDNIYAVIKGGAVNNDGAEKISYTSPSVKGQVNVIKGALKNAGLEASSIDYIEAHGTGTPIGDPIEVAALHKVYSEDKKCFNEMRAIGSIKSNIGHTDSAAGVMGLIKCALMLYHKYIPASLYFKKFNHEIESFNKLFYVPSKGKEWKHKCRDYKRRAAISAFGIGGTNCHMIMEEHARENKNNETCEKDIFLLPISAKTQKSLRNLASKWQNYLNSISKVEIADIVISAIKRREFFSHRGYLLLDKTTNKKDNVSIKNLWINEEISKDNLSLIFVITSDNFERKVNVSKQIKYLEKMVSAKIIPSKIYIREHDRVKHKGLEKYSNIIKHFDSYTEIINLESKSILCSTYNIAELSNKTKFYCMASHHDNVSYDSWIEFVGKLWALGVNIIWEKIIGQQSFYFKADIPTYCFDRQNYIFESPKIINVSKPEEDIAQKLRVIWAEILGISNEKIETNSNFFKKGGESLALLDLIEKIDKDFNVNFTLSEIINYLNFQDMLEAIKYSKIEEVNA